MKKKISKIFSFRKKEIINREIDAIPKCPGIYFLKLNVNSKNIKNRPQNKHLKKNKSDVRHIKNKIKMIGDKESIIYIGSSDNLNKRIRQYINTLFGDSTSHKGGVYASYISMNKFKEAVFEYRIVPNCYTCIEQKEIIKFVNKHQCLPLCNRKI